MRDPSATGRRATDAGGGKTAAAPTVLTGARDVLMVIDVQRDLCAGGSVAVPGANEIIPAINALVPFFGRWVYTRDWHPADHCSFALVRPGSSGSQPVHCVQGTQGAEWHPDLDIPINAILVSKGDEPDGDTLTGFRVERLDLARFLRLREVERIFITGLPLDLCVRETALDALAADFAVYLVRDAVCGTSRQSAERALVELAGAGAVIIGSEQLKDSGERPPPAYDEHGEPVGPRG